MYAMCGHASVRLANGSVVWIAPLDPRLGQVVRGCVFNRRDCAGAAGAAKRHRLLQLDARRASRGGGGP